jgi:succinyl-diaminopimelate desuccinylase
VQERNIERVRGHNVKTLIAMGGADVRLWSYEGIPPFVYRPYVHSMGSSDVYVEMEVFIDVLKIHILSAYDYLR